VVIIKLSLPALRIYDFKINILFLSLLLIHQFLSANIYQANYYSPENILKFAEYLYQEGDYIRAAAEFQRYLFYSGENLSAKDIIYYKVGLCYRFGNDLQKSINYFQKVISNYPQSDYLDDSYYQTSYCYFLMGKYKESISFSEANISFVKSYTIKLKMQQMIGINYIYQKEWMKALHFFDSFEIKDKNDSFTASLVNFTKEGQILPTKSRFLAGLMSSVISGSGKIYCHRTTDGLISLLTIGLASWQAYDGFHKNGIGSVKGWIYGTISAFFYLGNIYGSVVSVNIYNQQLENKFFKKIEIAINAYF